MGLRQDLARYLRTALAIQPADPATAGPAPPQGEFQQVPWLSTPMIGAGSRWTVADGMAAIQALDAGNFNRAGLLMDETLCDDAVYHGDRTRSLAISNLPQRFIPAKGHAGRRAARLLEKHWRLVMPPGTLKTILRYSLFMGFCLCEIVWLEVPDPEGPGGVLWVPQLKPWHPAWLQYVQALRSGGGDPGGGVWQVNTQGRIVDGRLQGASQVELSGSDRPGGGKWVLFSYGGALYPWKSAMVRALWQVFFRRLFTRRDHARYEERHGLPWLGVEYPVGWGGESPEWKAFMAALFNMGSSPILRLPQSADGKGGMKASLIEAKAQSYGSFASSKKEQDNDIYTLFLGQSISTAAGENGGSHAAMQGGRAMLAELEREDAVALSDAKIEYLDPEAAQTGSQLREALAAGDPARLRALKPAGRWRVVPAEGALREQVWRYFALWNFDDQEAAPYWLLDATPAEDMAAAEKARGERAKTVLDIARALTAFDKAGVLDKVDVPRLLEAAGVPLREGGEQGGGVLGGQVPDPAAAGAAPGPGAGQEPLGGVASELDPDPAR